MNAKESHNLKLECPDQKMGSSFVQKFLLKEEFEVGLDG